MKQEACCDHHLYFYDHAACDGLRVFKCLLDVVDGAKWHS